MPRDLRQLRTPALSVLLAVLATALPLTAGSPATAGLSATAAPPVPSTPSVGKAIEPFAEWQGNTICDPVDRPGVNKLARLIRQTYGSDESIGTSRNACYTSSEHNDGRALDWMIDTSKKQDMAKARAFLDWLMATDHAGNKDAMARRLGIMYIIFNHRMWRAYSPRGWGPYNGTNPHTDHIHISLSYDGSTGRSSFWKGQALADSCVPASLTTSAPKVSVDPMKYVPVAPTPVLSTATGTGTIGGRCRLFGSSSFHSHRVDALVTGAGSVPRKGVAAVALQVSMRQPNWDSYLTAGPAGGSIPSVRRISAAENQVGSSLMVLPVGADGKVSFFTNLGATDLDVSVVGYYVDPAAPVALQNRIAVDGGDQYDSVRPARLIGPQSLGAHGSLKIDVAGKVGTDPASTAAAVAVTVEAGSGHGDLFVFPSGGDRPTVPTLSYGTKAQTVTMLAPIGRGGAITVENSGSNSRAIDVDVVGAYEPAALKGGRGYSTRRTPITVVDTSRDLGLPKLGMQHARAFSVARGVNRSAESVLLEVTARGAKQNTRLTFWRADQGFPGTTSLSIPAGAVVSGIVVASLTDDGRVRVRNSGGAGLDLKVTVLGSFR